MNNSIVIRLETESLRVLNRLFTHGVDFKVISRGNGHTDIKVSVRQKRAVLDTAHDLNITAYIYQDRVIIRLYRNIISRIALTVGATIVTIFAFILSSMTLKIAVVGNNRVNRTDIISVLEDSGVKLNAFKVKDTRSIQNKIMSDIQDVSYANVYYSGTALVVEVHEELHKPPLNKNNEGAIIANYDGIITRIIVESGTPRVKVGDSVKKGDVLIEPYKEYGEGDDKRVVEVDAVGAVYATIYLEENIVLGEENIVVESSGNMKRQNRIFGTKTHSPYLHYAKKHTKKRLYSIIPLSIDTYIFEEKREIVYTFDNKNYRDKLIKCAYERLDERLFEGEKPIKEWIFQKRLDNLHIISVYYELERMISGG